MILRKRNIVRGKNDRWDSRKGEKERMGRRKKQQEKKRRKIHRCLTRKEWEGGRNKGREKYEGVGKNGKRGRNNRKRRAGRSTDE